MIDSDFNDFGVKYVLLNEHSDIFLVWGNVNTFAYVMFVLNISVLEGENI